MDCVKERFRKVSERVIRSLESRNMEGYYAEDREEALRLALSLIPEKDSVGWGGSETVDSLGLKEALAERGNVLLDRSKVSAEEAAALMRQTFSADWLLTGTNAISEDGVLVNIDGLSNRVSAIAFGPANVLVFASRNKLVKTAEDAYNRAKYLAAPANAQRFDITTPCHETGTCTMCRHTQCICCNILTTRYSRIRGRIKVILINEDMGF